MKVEWGGGERGGVVLVHEGLGLEKQEGDRWDMRGGRSVKK